MIEWVKALAPIVVAVIPILWAVIRTARDTRKTTAKDIDKLSAKLDKHVVSDEWENMKQRRVRILRFADEVSSGKNYSMEYWTDILEDIDDYEKYCDAHKEFHNSKGVMAIEFIKAKYMKIRGVKNVPNE